WIEYKLASILLAGPRYYDQIYKLDLIKIEETEYYPYFEKLMITFKEKPVDVMTDYTWCFVNAYPHLLCPPFESWYLEGKIAGISLQKVLEEYSKYNIKNISQVGDHAAVELEYASFLYLLGNDEEAKKFLIQHPFKWLHMLAQDIITHGKSIYLNSLGNYLLIFVNKEKEKMN
ncbi:molecular chaperone, partial [Acidianus sp. RZ1]|uniref:TorD/DmsD family molecular chaperone n=1 Tax=Acidianus sp. RZ1 TaxID=1540082 RepID=UPI001490B5C0